MDSPNLNSLLALLVQASEAGSNTRPTAGLDAQLRGRPPSLSGLVVTLFLAHAGIPAEGHLATRLVQPLRQPGAVAGGGSDAEQLRCGDYDPLRGRRSHDDIQPYHWHSLT